MSASDLVKKWRDGCSKIMEKKKKECVREYIIRTQVYERDPKNNNNNIVTRPDVRFWVDGVVCCSHGLYFSNLGCGSTFVNLS